MTAVFIEVFHPQETPSIRNLGRYASYLPTLGDVSWEHCEVQCTCVDSQPLRRSLFRVRDLTFTPPCNYYVVVEGLVPSEELVVSVETLLKQRLHQYGGRPCELATFAQALSVGVNEMNTQELDFIFAHCSGKYH